MTGEEIMNRYDLSLLFSHAALSLRFRDNTVWLREGSISG